MPYKRGQKWVAQVRKDGRRKERICETKREALEWEAAQRKLSVADWQVETPTVCLHDWATAYLDFSRTKFGHKTYHEKRSVFRRFFKAMDPGLSVERLTPGQVLNHLKSQAEGRSGYGANKDRKNLLAAWNWGIKYMGLPSPNPCLVDRFPEVRQKRYIPPEKDFWKVFEAAEDGQDKLMLMAYLHTGARRSELFRLTWEDVDFGEGTISLGTRKRLDGSLEYDSLPMTDELYHELLDHRQNSQSQWVFLNPLNNQPFVARRLWMRSLCEKAGVKAFGLHAIRHLTASILANAGEPAIRIQAILRHKKLATTERYLHRLTDLKATMQILSKNKSRLAEPSTPSRRQAKLEVVG